MAKFILGAVLKKRRLSKRQFAKMIEMRYEQVFRLFRDGYDPKLSLLNRIAKALKCRVRDLIKE
jgi:DNA-binding Xre family transcriptional regulator